MEKLKVFTNPLDYLALVFEEVRLRFKTEGKFPITDQVEFRFFADDAQTFSGLTTELKPTSKVVIGIKPVGMSFYLIDEVVNDHFIGYRLNTHLNFILSSTEIAYVRGYFCALSKTNFANK